MPLNEYEQELALRERKMAVRNAAKGNMSPQQRSAALRAANMKYKASVTGRDQDPAIQQAIGMAEDAAKISNLNAQSVGQRSALLGGATSLDDFQNDEMDIAEETDPASKLARSINSLRGSGGAGGYRSGKYSQRRPLETISNIASGLRARQDEALSNPMTKRPNKPYSLYSEEEA